MIAAEIVRAMAHLLQYARRDQIDDACLFLASVPSVEDPTQKVPVFLCASNMKAIEENL